MLVYEIRNGHYIIDLEGKKWLLDTGSPTTFRFDGQGGCIELDGKVFSLERNRGYIKSAVDGLCGVNVFGMIGSDVLSQTSFTLYSDNKLQLMANQKSDYSFDVSCYDNVILGYIEIEGRRVKTLFDTGASLNYLMPGAFTFDLNNTSIVHDLDNQGRKITSNLVIAKASLGGKKMDVSFGIPQHECNATIAMAHYGCQAIVGIYNYYLKKPLFNHMFSVDYQNGKIFID